MNWLFGVDIIQISGEATGRSVALAGSFSWYLPLISLSNPSCRK
jgi:hypothetical protein